MFSIHDRVSWDERQAWAGFIYFEGTIVAEEDNDHYLVKRDTDGKCQKLCYRKLRKIND